MCRETIWLLAIVCLCKTVFGSVAKPGCYWYTLPGNCGGKKVCIIEKGNAFRNAKYLKNGYPLCPDKNEKGYYFFEQDNSGHLYCGNVTLDCTHDRPAGNMEAWKLMPYRVDPESLKRDHEGSILARLQRERKNSGRGLENEVKTYKNLVLLIRFKNHKGKPNIPKPRQIREVFNHNGPHRELAPTGSVSDYYKSQTYGKIEIINVVTPWMDVDVTQP
mmetsp:Transcript_43477/g.69560  ORF Transcript_43477/g.69560 Transcript_43477/m.69560 type:complete len:218 (+) Transcript_43477:491-1144(+)